MSFQLLRRGQRWVLWVVGVHPISATNVEADPAGSSEASGTTNAANIHRSSYQYKATLKSLRRVPENGSDRRIWSKHCFSSLHFVHLCLRPRQPVLLPQNKPTFLNLHDGSPLHGSRLRSQLLALSRSTVSRTCPSTPIRDQSRNAELPYAVGQRCIHIVDLPSLLSPWRACVRVATATADHTGSRIADRMCGHSNNLPTSM